MHVIDWSTPSTCVSLSLTNHHSCLTACGSLQETSQDLHTCCWLPQGLRGPRPALLAVPCSAAVVGAVACTREAYILLP